MPQVAYITGKPSVRGYEPGTTAYGVMGALVFGAAAAALSVVTFGLGPLVAAGIAVGSALVGGSVTAGMSEGSLRNRDRKLVGKASRDDARSTKRAARHGLTVSTLLAVATFALLMTIPGVSLGMLAAGLIAGGTFVAGNTIASIAHFARTMGRRGVATAVGMSYVASAALLTALVLTSTLALQFAIGLGAGLVAAPVLSWALTTGNYRIAAGVVLALAAGITAIVLSVAGILPTLGLIAGMPALAIAGIYAAGAMAAVGVLAGAFKLGTLLSQRVSNFLNGADEGARFGKVARIAALVTGAVVLAAGAMAAVLFFTAGGIIPASLAAVGVLTLSSSTAAGVCLGVAPDASHQYLGVHTKTRNTGGIYTSRMSQEMRHDITLPKPFGAVHRAPISALTRITSTAAVAVEVKREKHSERSHLNPKL